MREHYNCLATYVYLNFELYKKKVIMAYHTVTGKEKLKRNDEILRL